MTILKTLFWTSIAIVFYSYLGYAIFVWILLKIRGKKPGRKIAKDSDFQPPVTLIVAVFNEENVIRQKIKNCLLLDYPKEKLKLVFVADGSTDRTVSIIKEYPELELLYKPERQGKVAAINRAMSAVSTEYVIFCDANTFLNPEAVREIIKHYSDETTGAVAGEKKVIEPNIQEKPGKEGEGIYWKYESALKKIDSDFYSVVGAAGELFSLRTSLFEPVPPNVLLDDFIISLNICKKGYRVVYEPAAFAEEAPSLTLNDELKRKIRIGAGGFQSIVMQKDLLNIFKYGKLSFLYISHRVLRWALCPFLLPIIIASNSLIVLLSVNHGGILYQTLLVAQAVFYFSALAGWLLSLSKIKISLLYIPYYFLFMNYAMYIGLSRYLNHRQTVLWEKAKRA